MLDITRSPLLEGVTHGFLGRAGGVSDGIYSGLNIGLGSDDDRDAIMENRRRATEGVSPGSELVTVHQIHSADVVTVTGPLPLDQRPQADAMVTDQPNLLLGILTADCVPVLFHDAKAGVIGAAHAGWKGAPAHGRFCAAGKPGHFQFDIESYVAARLQDAGAGGVDKLGLDTYVQEDRYYSYRRSCHRGEPGYGRQISLIGMAE